MATMNISLPDDMKDFVDQQVRARGYMSASEYIRDLVRRQSDIEAFRATIDEGAKDPTGIDLFGPDYFAELSARIDRHGE